MMFNKIFLVLLSLVIYTQAAFQHGTITSSQLKEDRWFVFNKFGFGRGRGSYEIRYRLTRGYKKQSNEKLNLHFEIHIDDHISRTWDMECKEKQSAARNKYDLELPQNGEWSDFYVKDVTAKIRAHMWFWAIEDCDNNLPLDAYIEWEMNSVNSNGSQFTYSESGLQTVNFCFLSFFVVYLYFNVSLLRNYKIRNSESDYAMYFLVAAMICELLSLGMLLIHQITYEFNGTGILTFPTIVQALTVMSQFILTLLFILISMGWTIEWSNLSNLDIFIPITVVLALCHLTLVIAKRVTENSMHTWHDYDGIPGFFMMLMRVGMGLWFLYNFFQTSMNSKSPQIGNFLIGFGVMGAINFLTMPVIFMLNYLVIASYLQQLIMFIGICLQQCLSIWYFSRLLTTKNSEYYKISLKNRTELPTWNKSSNV